MAIASEPVISGDAVRILDDFSGDFDDVIYDLAEESAKERQREEPRIVVETADVLRAISVILHCMRQIIESPTSPKSLVDLAKKVEQKMLVSGTSSSTSRASSSTSCSASTSEK